MEIGGRNWGNARKRCGCVELWEGLLTEEKEIKIFVKVKCATYVINGRFERNARKSWSLILRNITSKLKWKIDKPSFVFVKKITLKHIANRKFPIEDWYYFIISSGARYARLRRLQKKISSPLVISVSRLHAAIVIARYISCIYLITLSYRYSEALRHRTRPSVFRHAEAVEYRWTIIGLFH